MSCAEDTVIGPMHIVVHRVISEKLTKILVELIQYLIRYRDDYLTLEKNPYSLEDKNKCHSLL